VPDEQDDLRCGFSGRCPEVGLHRGVGAELPGGVDYIKSQGAIGGRFLWKNPVSSDQRSTCDRLGPDQGQLNGSKL